MKSKIFLAAIAAVAVALAGSADARGSFSGGSFRSSSSFSSSRSYSSSSWSSPSGRSSGTWSMGATASPTRATGTWTRPAYTAPRTVYVAPRTTHVYVTQSYGYHPYGGFWHGMLLGSYLSRPAYGGGYGYGGGGPVVVQSNPLAGLFYLLGALAVLILVVWLCARPHRTRTRTTRYDY